MSDIGGTLKSARTSMLWFAVALAVGVSIATAVIFADAAGIMAAIGLLGVLVFLAFWLMAAPRAVSDRGCRWALMAFIALSVIWPSYISIRIPGLPWIHFARLALATTTILFLYCIFNSRTMRRDVVAALVENRALCLCLAGFVASQFASIVFSPSPGTTVGRFFVAQVYWTLPFFVTLAVVRTEKQLFTLLALLVGIGSIEALLGLIEAYQHQNVWVRWLPPGFAADLEYLARALADQMRDGRFRSRGSFLLPLTYAEFLAIVLPLAYYLLVYHPGRLWRIFGGVSALLILAGIVVSNTRLGINGALVSTVGAVGLGTLRMWVNRKNSLAGPLTLTLLPLIFGALLIVVLLTPIVSNATFGGGSTQGSTDARFAQWALGIPKIWSSPLFGRGIGGASEILGFTTLGGFQTIDTYMLSILLEVGIVGFLCFLGAFVIAIITGSRLFLTENRPIFLASGALTASFIGFLVIKVVLSQVENHTLVFVMLAVLVQLKTHCSRSKDTAAEPGTPPAAQPAMTAAAARSRLPSGRLAARRSTLTISG